MAALFIHAATFCRFDNSGRLRLDGAGDVAEAVGYRLAGTGCPHYEDDEAYQGNEVDEPPAAGLAYVVHAAPRYGEVGHNEED